MGRRAEYAGPRLAGTRPYESEALDARRYPTSLARNELPPNFVRGTRSSRLQESVLDQLPEGSAMQPYEGAHSVQGQGGERIRGAKYQRGWINKVPVDGVRAVHGKPRPE